MITQPNLVCEIVLTFKMVPSKALANATIYICFVDGEMANRLVDLDCLEKK